MSVNASRHLASRNMVPHTGRDSHDLCVKYHYIAAGENECKIIRNITAHVTDLVLYAKRLGVCVSHNAPPVADRPMRSL